MEQLTFNDVPDVLQTLLIEIKELRQEVRELKDNGGKQPYVTMKMAEQITGRSANALRMQIHLGKLKSIKRDGKHVFDREYLESWVAGEVDEEHFESADILKIRKIKRN